MIQRLTHTHFAGVPLEHQNITFTTTSGITYRLTAYQTEDSKIVWIDGYREQDGMRFYTSRTPDELLTFGQIPYEGDRL